MVMETAVYTYEVIQPGDDALIHKTTECLMDTFLGVQIGELWVQEPIIGYALKLPRKEFYAFTKSYIEDHVAQGYCVVALDEERNVVGTFVGDHNAFVIGEFPTFTGAFANMNTVVDVLDDIDERFLTDYALREGKSLQDGDIVHIFLIGVSAPINRHEVIRQLGALLEQQARRNGVRMLLAEATTPKSVRVLQKYHGFEKYITVDGEHIVYPYNSHKQLAVIPESTSDGIYIVTKSLT